MMVAAKEVSWALCLAAKALRSWEWAGMGKPANLAPPTLAASARQEWEEWEEGGPKGGDVEGVEGPRPLAEAQLGEAPVLVLHAQRPHPAPIPLPRQVPHALNRHNPFL